MARLLRAIWKAKRLTATPSSFCRPATLRPSPAAIRWFLRCTGMKHSEFSGRLYIRGPWCMSAGGAGGGRGGRGGGRGADMETAGAEAKTPAEAAKLPGLATQLAVAAAWSPNPKKPPLYFDMPFGDAQQEVLNKWAANAPLVFVHQYIGNLKQDKTI